MCPRKIKKKPEGKITKEHITNRAKLTTREIKSNDSNDLIKNKTLPARLCVSLFRDEPVLKSRYCKSTPTHLHSKHTKTLF